MITLSEKAESFNGTLNDFMVRLLSYNRSSVVDAGSYILTQIFCSTESHQPQHDFIIEAYGPKIIILALSTCYEDRSRMINSYPDFFNLCNDYMSIQSSISNQEFLTAEVQQICQALSSREPKKGEKKIPEKFIQQDHIWAAGLFMARHVTAQNAARNSHKEEFYRDYLIIESMDKQSNGKITEIFRTAYNASILQVMRAGFGLFSLALEGNGLINLHKLPFEKDLVDRLHIDRDITSRVAQAISCKESTLREEWYEKEILKSKHPEMYWHYIPSPLYKCPLVSRDQLSGEQYLMPAPQIFIRSFREALFSAIYSKKPNSIERGSINNWIGTAFEDHIEIALKRVFGAGNVERNPAQDADFLVSLSRTELVIEVKTGIGSEEESLVMAPAHIANLWSRLYKPITQCAARYKELHTDKLKVAMVIIADDIVGVADPFIQFGNKSGLFTELGLAAIEIVSWNDLEIKLSRTSVENLEQALLEKWQKPDAWNTGAITRHQIPHSIGAHNYEYLEEAGRAIWNEPSPSLTLPRKREREPLR